MNTTAGTMAQSAPDLGGVRPAETHKTNDPGRKPERASAAGVIGGHYA